MLLAGETVTKSVSFTMPGSDTDIFVYLERWAFDHWMFIANKLDTVNLSAPEPEPEPVPETEFRALAVVVS